MKNYKELYNQLTLTNDFMFMKVMKNKKLCKKLLEIILGIEIEKIEYIEEQKVIDLMRESHGVRLDVYVKDGMNTVYNVEMQTIDTKNIPKRSRYYQSAIDLTLLQSGEDYKNLNKSYVIFICTFDIFGKGRHIYTFENYCKQDKEILLGDETAKVFLNPYSEMDDVDKELGNFLRYLADANPVDDFTEELDREVVKAKENKEWRREFMTMSMKLREEREEGRKEGRQEGRQEGTLLTVYKFVKDGTITLQKASETVNMTEEEFLAAVKQFND